MYLHSAELEVCDLLVPWAFGIAVIGFVVAWGITAAVEYTGLTRFIWHVPLFFLALLVLVSCLLGICFAP